MLSIVSDLFVTNNYGKVEVEEGILFSKNEGDNKKDFWFVLEANNLDDIEDKQPDILNKCREAMDINDLEKNTSMLIIWNTGGDLDFVHMKKQIMKIEENPYFFKKHVLYYSLSEYSELIENISNSDTNEFFIRNISSETNFAQYKKNPVAGTWRELFYRIIIKLPFISINIDDSTDIESLQATINIDLSENNTVDKLFDIESKIFELYNETGNDEIESFEVSEVVSNLLVVLNEGETNGN